VTSQNNTRHHFELIPPSFILLSLLLHLLSVLFSSLETRSMLSLHYSTRIIRWIKQQNGSKQKLILTKYAGNRQIFWILHKCHVIHLHQPQEKPHCKICLIPGNTKLTSLQEMFKSTEYETNSVQDMFKSKKYEIKLTSRHVSVQGIWN